MVLWKIPLAVGIVGIFLTLAGMSTTAFLLHADSLTLGHLIIFACFVLLTAVIAYFVQKSYEEYKTLKRQANVSRVGESKVDKPAIKELEIKPLGIELEVDVFAVDGELAVKYEVNDIVVGETAVVESAVKSAVEPKVKQADEPSVKTAVGPAVGEPSVKTTVGPAVGEPSVKSTVGPVVDEPAVKQAVEAEVKSKVGPTAEEMDYVVKLVMAKFEQS